MANVRLLSLHVDLDGDISILQNNLQIFPMFQLIRILRLEVMHNYVQWRYSKNYCDKISLVDESLWKLLLFHIKMISALFL